MGVSLKVDLERYKCDIDMVDGALERFDLNFSKRDMFKFSFTFLFPQRRRFSRQFFRFLRNLKFSVSNYLDFRIFQKYGRL